MHDVPMCHSMIPTILERSVTNHLRIQAAVGVVDLFSSESVHSCADGMQWIVQLDVSVASGICAAHIPVPNAGTSNPTLTSLAVEVPTTIILDVVPKAAAMSPLGWGAVLGTHQGKGDRL
jgi:hypothetical protein